MARVIKINYYYELVKYPYVNPQKYTTQFGPVMYDINQGTDNINSEQRTTGSFNILISDKS